VGEEREAVRILGIGSPLGGSITTAILGRLQHVAEYAESVGPHAPVYSAEAGRRQPRYEGLVPGAVGPAAHATAHPQWPTEGDHRRWRASIEPAHPTVRRQHSSRAQTGKGKANWTESRGRGGNGR
jgi:hypothetical protein